MRKKIIAPSLLSCDFARIADEITAITEAGADWLHVDVMDGHFVPNITIGPMVVDRIKKVSPLPLDVHLMIDNPEKYIPAFVKAGADIITIHVESTESPGKALEMIKNLDVRAGITLRPKTKLDEVLPFLHLVDMVLVMTVEPGFGGQSFMEDQLPKLHRLRKHLDEHHSNVLIEVDGGINDKTIGKVKDADVIVAGSYVFDNDYREAIQFLRR